MANVLADQEYARANFDYTLQGREVQGRIFNLYFSHDTGVRAVANGDTLQLTRIPKGVRVIGGAVAFGDMGAGATAIIGTEADDNRYLDTTDVSAAGSADIANTLALNMGELINEETIVYLTAGGANYAAGQKIVGYITVLTV